MGGSADSSVMASATTGNGAVGGNGGDSTGGNAGTFDASNNMTSSVTNGAGIISLSQNTGANALTQIGVTVQANLTVQ
jgi:hypothetical protein